MISAKHRNDKAATEAKTQLKNVLVSNIRFGNAARRSLDCTMRITNKIERKKPTLKIQRNLS